MKKTVIIAGATGFIGRVLVAEFIKQQYHILVLTRNIGRTRKIFGPGVQPVKWGSTEGVDLRSYLDDTDLVINLAGESVAAFYWGEQKRRAILDSRLRSANFFLDTLSAANGWKGTYIQASAIGFYGNRGNERITEETKAGQGFLAQVSQKWEEPAFALSGFGVRSVVLRLGIVLGASGGIWKKMRLPFQLFIGAIPGSGSQWISWIHVEDALRTILFIREHPEVAGVVNLCSPNPLPAALFYRLLGKHLHRPVLFRLPEWLLKLFNGDVADEMVLASQRVYPQKLLQMGFRFKYPHADQAFAQIVSEAGSSFLQP